LAAAEVRNQKRIAYSVARKCQPNKFEDPASVMLCRLRDTLFGVESLGSRTNYEYICVNETRTESIVVDCVLVLKY